MLAEHVEGRAVGPHVEAPPALGEGHEAGDGARPFQDRVERLADLDAFPPAGRGAPGRLRLVVLGDDGDLLRRPPVGLDVVPGGPLPGHAPLGADAPGVRPAQRGAVLVPERHLVGLLDGPAGEGALQVEEVLEDGLGGDAHPEADRREPVPVRPGEHGVDAGQPAHVAAHHPVEGVEERARGHDAAPAGRGGVGVVEPQRVAVADAQRPVPQRVAGDLGHMGVGPLEGLADAGPQLGQGLVGDEREVVHPSTVENKY